MRGNRNKLKGRIVEKYGTCQAFAEAVGISKSTVSGFLHGYTHLSARKIEDWAKALDIPKKEYGDYFFT